MLYAHSLAIDVGDLFVCVGERKKTMKQWKIKKQVIRSGGRALSIASQKIIMVVNIDDLFHTPISSDYLGFESPESIQCLRLIFGINGESQGSKSFVDTGLKNTCCCIFMTLSLLSQNTLARVIFLISANWSTFYNKYLARL